MPWDVLIPVFPPTDESTCDNNVVGILTNFKISKKIWGLQIYLQCKWEK